MIDARYLTDLIPILKLHGVKSIKMQGLELTFSDSMKSIVPLSEANSIQNIVDSVKKQEAFLPPDLRADDLMNEEKVLNWSSPDQPHDQIDMPLTGEGAL